MAVLNAAARRALPKADFAVPAKAPGSGSYPLPNRAHAINALARSSGKPVAAVVRRKVAAKFPAIAQGMKKGGLVEAEEKGEREDKGESRAKERGEERAEEKAGTGGKDDKRKKMRRGGFVPFKKKPAMPMDQAGEMAARADRAAQFESQNGNAAF